MSNRLPNITAETEELTRKLGTLQLEFLYLEKQMAKNKSQYLNGRVIGTQNKSRSTSQLMDAPGFKFVERGLN